MTEIPETALDVAAEALWRAEALFHRGRLELWSDVSGARKDRYREFAAAVITAYEAAMWQPVDQAPLLEYHDEEPRHLVYALQLGVVPGKAVRRPDGSLYSNATRTSSNREITHFRPLPDPPGT